MWRFILLLLFLPLSLSAKHIGPSYDTKPREALDVFAKGLAKKYHLQFLNSGTGALADAKGVWALSLTSGAKMTIDEARVLATTLSCELLDKIFHDPLFANYCQKTASRHRPAEVRVEDAAFKLAFWDENVNRPLYPYVAQVRLADGKLYYHYADPQTQALQEPITESLPQ